MAEAVGLPAVSAGYIKKLHAAGTASRLPAVELIVVVGVTDSDDECVVAVRADCDELQVASSGVRGVGGRIGCRFGGR